MSRRAWVYTLLFQVRCSVSNQSYSNQYGSGQKDEEPEEGDDDVEEFTPSQSSASGKFEGGVLALRNLSFISISPGGTTFEMHRLVQLATRKWLEAHEQLERWN